MDQETWGRVQANLYPPAQGAVEPWQEFPWHLGRSGICDTDRLHSSQALAIDLFGTIKQSEACDAVCDAFAALVELPQGGPWEVHLEWLDPQNRLQERWTRRTQVDALAQSPRAAMAFECKFTEADGGPCSQPLPLASGPNRGLVQCDGKYRLQINPVTGKEGRCSLTSKGIRYWEVIPHIFGLDAEGDRDPCPFAGPQFQWMRNLAICHELSLARNVPTAFFVVYADAPGLPMAEHVRSDEWDAFVQSVAPQAVTFRTFTFQRLTQVALTAAVGAGAEVGEWNGLSAWITGKIRRVAEARNG